MFMFKRNLGEIDKVKKLEEQIKQLQDRIDYGDRELQHVQTILKSEREEIQFKIDKAIFEKAKSMEQKLIESDLKRVEAVAKYNTYVEMDTKEDHKVIVKMLEKAIDGLSQQVKQPIQVTKQ